MCLEEYFLVFCYTSPSRATSFAFLVYNINYEITFTNQNNRVEIQTHIETIFFSSWNNLKAELVGMPKLDVDGMSYASMSSWIQAEKRVLDSIQRFKEVLIASKEQGSEMDTSLKKLAGLNMAKNLRDMGVKASAEFLFCDLESFRTMLRGLDGPEKDALDFVVHSVSDAAAPELGDITEKITNSISSLASFAQDTFGDALSTLGEAYDGGMEMIGGDISGIIWDKVQFFTKSLLFFIVFNFIFKDGG